MIKYWDTVETRHIIHNEHLLWIYNLFKQASKKQVLCKIPDDLASDQQVFLQPCQHAESEAYRSTISMNCSVAQVISLQHGLMNDPHSVETNTW